MSVQTVKRTTNRAFIGRAWINQMADGKKNLSVRLDRDIVQMAIKTSDGSIIRVNPREFKGNKSIDMLLFPNSRREGKNDAHFRLSVSLPEEPVEEKVVEPIVVEDIQL